MSRDDPWPRSASGADDARRPRPRPLPFRNPRARRVRLWNGSAPLEFEIVPPFWMTAWFRGLAALALGLRSWHPPRATAWMSRRNAELERLQHELEEAYAGLRNLADRLEAAKKTSASASRTNCTTNSVRRSPPRSSTCRCCDDRSRIRCWRAGSTRRYRWSMHDQRPRHRTRLRPRCSTTRRDPGARLPPQVGGRAIGVRSTSSPSGPGDGCRNRYGRVPGGAGGRQQRAAPRTGADGPRAAAGGGGVLVLRIEDDGVGFDPATVQQRVNRGDHLGLLGMSERVRSAGGRLRLEASPGRGSLIEARVPCRAHDRADAHPPRRRSRAGPRRHPCAARIAAGLEVVGECGDGLAALERCGAIRRTSCCSTSPCRASAASRWSRASRGWRANARRHAVHACLGEHAARAFAGGAAGY